jgi:hypothetical protein
MNQGILVNQVWSKEKKALLKNGSNVNKKYKNKINKNKKKIDYGRSLKGRGSWGVKIKNKFKKESTSSKEEGSRGSRAWFQGRFQRYKNKGI